MARAQAQGKQYSSFWGIEIGVQSGVIELTVLKLRGDPTAFQYGLYSFRLFNYQ